MANPFRNWFNRKEEPAPATQETPRPAYPFRHLPLYRSVESPEKRVEREMVDKGFVRGFVAADTSDLYYGWTAPSTSIDGILKGQLDLIRSRSREQMRNNDYAKGFIRGTVNNVIGTEGVKLDVLARFADGKVDTLVSDIVEREWGKWGKYSQNVDVTNHNNWNEILRHIFNVYLTDGEVFIRHIYGKGNYGYSIQVIDPALCDTNLNVTLKNGNEIVMGVELDEWRKPVAYWFKSKSGESVPLAPNNGNKYVRVEAANIIHAFVRDFPDQTRGIPPMATALARLQMLDTYEESALVAAKYGASIPGFYSRDGDSTDPATTIENGELVQEVAPGEIPLLPLGYNFNQVDTKYPDGGDFPEFVKAMLRGIAAGLGIDYHSLANDAESVNYSSARIFMLESREVYKALQEWLISNVIRPIYEKWLMASLLNRKIVIANRVMGVEEFDRANDVKWLPKRWAWIDPQKDAQGALLLLKYRIKSISTIANELGVDWGSEIAKIARDEAKLKELGLTYLSVPEATLQQGNLDDEKPDQ